MRVVKTVKLKKYVSDEGYCMYTANLALGHTILNLNLSELSGYSIDVLMSEGNGSPILEECRFMIVFNENDAIYNTKDSQIPYFPCRFITSHFIECVDKTAYLFDVTGGLLIV